MASPRIQVLIDGSAEGLQRAVAKARKQLGDLEDKLDNVGGKKSRFGQLGDAASNLASQHLGPLGDAADAAGSELGEGEHGWVFCARTKRPRGTLGQKTPAVRGENSSPRRKLSGSLAVPTADAPTARRPPPANRRDFDQAPALLDVFAAPMVRL